MDDLESLELLSLVSKVTSELQNYLGINDKTLAEFVIAQHAKCQSLADFKSQMEAMGAEFPQSLVESVDRLILTMHPNHKGKSKAGLALEKTDGVLNEVDKKTRIFKGLAVPDREPQYEVEESDPELKNQPPASGLDDTFAMLEGPCRQSQTIRERYKWQKKKQKSRECWR